MRDETEPNPHPVKKRVVRALTRPGDMQAALGTVSL